MATCPRCGATVQPNWKNCPNCGVMFAGASSGRAASGRTAARTSQRRSAPPISNAPSGDGGAPTGQWRKTIAAQIGGPSALTFTFMEGGQVLAQTEIPLNKDMAITFGRKNCDLVVNPPSHTVSSRHGAIVVRNGRCYIKDLGSSNGIYLNGVKQPYCRVGVGDVIVIGQALQGQTRTVIIIGDAGVHLNVFDLSTLSVVRVGRMPENELVIPNSTLSATHATLTRTTAGWYIQDNHSAGGTKVNGGFINQPVPLFSGSVIVLGNCQMVFLDSCLVLFGERQGVDVSAERLVRYRMNHGKRRVTTDHISLHIKRGEFVAIVGGSGSGKSTLLNELSGTEPADEGSVAVDGTDLYANYEMLKTSIGYVPQQDIVYDNLTVESMLLSAAKLRMTPDTTRKERRARVNEVIALLELDGVRHNLIGNLSGGQKKRASIGVELLADPRLLFLDEPTSGLDPGIERKLMQTLAAMAHDGRTIILVTHNTLNLHLCDQVVFLGYGGKLCYAGRPAGAMSFFDVSDLVDVYTKIDENPEGWQQAFAVYNSQDEASTQMPSGPSSRARRRMPRLSSQFFTLSARYVRLILSDRSRLILLLLQGPLLAAVISLVASKDCYVVYERGKSCLFALSCAAFWVGIFNSIQEVCKERDIFLREYGGGVRLGAYVASKVVVLGSLCVLQAAALCGVFFAVTDLLGKAGGSLGAGCILDSAQMEVWVAMTLLTLSAMCLGLLVSALFDNPDRAIALAPLLIMPQILFAGVVFKMDVGSISDRVSYAVNCRWGMEALGTTFDLDSKDLAIYGETLESEPTEKEVDVEVTPDEIGPMTVDTGYGTQQVTPTEPIKIENKKVQIDGQELTIDDKTYEHNPSKLDNNMFTHSKEHLIRAWAILAGFCVICVTGCQVVLGRSVKR